MAVIAEKISKKKKNTIVNTTSVFHSYHSELSKISKVVKKW